MPRRPPAVTVEDRAYFATLTAEELWDMADETADEIRDLGELRPCRSKAELRRRDRREADLNAWLAAVGGVLDAKLAAGEETSR